jgi:hypothetical protein
VATRSQRRLGGFPWSSKQGALQIALTSSLSSCGRVNVSFSHLARGALLCNLGSHYSPSQRWGTFYHIFSNCPFFASTSVRFQPHRYIGYMFWGISLARVTSHCNNVLVFVPKNHWERCGTTLLQMTSSLMRRRQPS